MKFKQYLIEKEMSFDAALKVFGISAIDASDKDELKKKYRILAMKNHTDRGGDIEKIKDINNAYEVLSKAQVNISIQDEREKSREEYKMKYRSAGAQIKTSLLSNFQPDVFIKYFQDLSGDKYFYEITRVYPTDKQMQGKYNYPTSAGFEVEFFTKDRSSVFTFSVSSDLRDIVFPKAELGHADISYNVYTSAFGFHMNKKQKMSQRDWKFTRDHSFFRKPEELFPSKKMKDIFSGKTSKRAFKKRDMELFLIKKLGSKFGSGDYVWIPLGEDFSLVVYRSVFMRQGIWGTNGIYRKNTREQMGPVASFAEEEQTAHIFEKIQKEVMKVNGDAKIKKAIDLIKQAYEAYKKSKGI